MTFISRRCAIHTSRGGGEGSTDVLCSQSEQETVSREWVFDSGISNYSDHSAHMDVLERLLEQ